MKLKFYKSLPNSLAKTRISKLVEANRSAWEDFRRAEKLGVKAGDPLYDYRLQRAIGFQDALLVMGIAEHEWMVEDLPNV